MKVPQSEGANEIFINHLLEASLDFNQELFDRILHNIILHMGFEKAITQVVWPFLRKIGLLWLTGNVVPAQEHFASAIITKKLLVAANGLESPLPPAAGARQVLLFTPPGEFHEMPLLFMRYLMKKNGTPTLYFGPNISLEDLKTTCSRQPVTHLYFHLVTNLLRCEPDQYIQQLTDAFPGKTIVFSGSRGVDLSFRHPRVRVLTGLEEMQAFAREH